MVRAQVRESGLLEHSFQMRYAPLVHFVRLRGAKRRFAIYSRQAAQELEETCRGLRQQVPFDFMQVEEAPVE